MTHWMPFFHVLGEWGSRQEMMHEFLIKWRQWEVIGVEGNRPGHGELMRHWLPSACQVFEWLGSSLFSGAVVTAYFHPCARLCKLRSPGPITSPCDGHSSLELKVWSVLEARFPHDLERKQRRAAFSRTFWVFSVCWKLGIHAGPQCTSVRRPCPCPVQNTLLSPPEPLRWVPICWQSRQAAQNQFIASHQFKI